MQEDVTPVSVVCTESNRLDMLAKLVLQYEVINRLQQEYNTIRSDQTHTSKVRIQFIVLEHNLTSWVCVCGKGHPLIHLFLS